MLLSALLFVGCGEKEETSVDISQFDNTCTVDEDCMSVFTGSVCGCDCSTAGINISESQAFDIAYQAAYESCDEVFECFMCPDVEAFCDEGTCHTREIDLTEDTAE